MSEPPPRRTYSQEEVTEILKRALRQQSLRSEVLSHEQLVEMANEVGIDREALESATADLAQTRANELTRQSEARELAEERARLLSRFASSLFFYIVIGAALYFIDQRYTGGTWFYWVLLGWGIGLAFRLRSVFFPEESLRRRKARAEKIARRMEKRAAREALHRRLTEGLHGAPHELVNAGAREFETAVQAGVAALLSVAARKIQEHAARAHHADEQGDPTKRRR